MSGLFCQEQDIVSLHPKIKRLGRCLAAHRGSAVRHGRAHLSKLPSPSVLYDSNKVWRRYQWVNNLVKCDVSHEQVNCYFVLLLTLCIAILWAAVTQHQSARAITIKERPSHSLLNFTRILQNCYCNSVTLPLSSVYCSSHVSYIWLYFTGTIKGLLNWFNCG